MKCPASSLPSLFPFLDLGTFLASKQLAGSELGICLLGVFLHLRILIQDSAFCAPSLFTDYSLARSPFMVHLFHLFLDAHVSIFKIRPGISAIFLTKIRLFFPFFFLSLFDHLCLSYSLIPATIAGNLSTQFKISPFVCWKLTPYSRSSYSQEVSPSTWYLLVSEASP